MTENARHRARPQLRRAIVIVLSVVLSALSLGIVAPAQAAAPEKQEVGSYVCVWYTVRRGDTLSEIGAKFGVSVHTLRRVNGLKSTRIYAGQKLCIPRNTPVHPSPPPSGSGAWYAEFWNNTTQSGPAALVRNDAAINFNWGFGSPDLSRVQPDFFSGRWTRNVNFSQGGVYRFAFNVDDGVRLTINNQVVLDSFNFVGSQQPAVDVPLAAGLNRITVDYAEQQGVAYIQFSYQLVAPPPPPCTPGYNCPPPPPDGAKFNNGPWATEYFANPEFAGAPTFVRTECCMRFAWNGGSPAPGIPGSFWTARFRQTRYFPAGVYQFVARVDDGIRIYLDGQLIMNEFRQQSTRTFTADANLGAGNHTIVVEYVQYGGTSDLSLYWDFLGDPNAPARPVSAAMQYFPGQP